MGLHDDFLVLNRADLDGLNLTWAEVMDVIDDAFVTDTSTAADVLPATVFVSANRAVK